jgi:hypothetical protein
MRPDMAKLLTEAERYGSKNRSQKWGKRLKYDPDSDYDDQPSRASMSRHWQDSDGGKTLSDVLNPLKGYLHKNVGRHWDDVYSEICQNLDRRSVTGLHVFTHLWQFVAKNTVMCIDGKVREWGYYGGFLTEPSDYYIHPYTGILCDSGNQGTRYRYPKKKEPITNIRISDIASYNKFDGIWYYCENYKIEREGLTEEKPWSYVRIIERDGFGWYVIKEIEYVSTKVQLNIKELKKAGLKNDPPNPKAFSRRERKALERK